MRGALAQESNQLALLSRPRSKNAGGVAGEPVVSKAEMMVKMNVGRQWMVTLLTYAQAHDLRLPPSLANALASNGPSGDGADSYELVQAGLDLRSVASPSRTLVLREKKPWKGRTSQWQRSYAFADGHVELAFSDTPDFSEWEIEKQETPEPTPPGPEAGKASH